MMFFYRNISKICMCNVCSFVYVTMGPLRNDVNKNSVIFEILPLHYHFQFLFPPLVTKQKVKKHFQKNNPA